MDRKVEYYMPVTLQCSRKLVKLMRNVRHSLGHTPSVQQRAIKELQAYFTPARRRLLAEAEDTLAQLRRLLDVQ